MVFSGADPSPHCGPVNITRISTRIYERTATNAAFVSFRAELVEDREAALVDVLGPRVYQGYTSLPDVVGEEVDLILEDALDRPTTTGPQLTAQRLELRSWLLNTTFTSITTSGLGVPEPELPADHPCAALEQDMILKARFAIDMNTIWLMCVNGDEDPVPGEGGGSDDPGGPPGDFGSENGGGSSGGGNGNTGGESEYRSCPDEWAALGEANAAYWTALLALVDCKAANP